MKWAIIQFHEYDTEMSEHDDYDSAKEEYDNLFIRGVTTAYLVEIKEKKGRS